MPLIGKAQTENRFSKVQVRSLFGQHLVRSIEAVRGRSLAGNALPKPEQDRIVSLLALAFERSTAELWTIACELVESIAPMMEQALVWQEWMHLLQIGLKQSKLVGDRAAEALFSLLLGFEEQRLGAWADAEQLYLDSVTLYAAQESTTTYGVALGRLGYLKYLQGALDEALRYADESLAQFDGCEFESHRGYFIRGVVALAQVDTGEAIWWINRSLDICQLHDNQRLVAMRYRTLGWAFTKQKDLAQGRKYLEEAIDMFDKMGDVNECAAAKMNLGIVFATDEQHLRALDLYAEAAPVFRQLFAQLNLAMLYNNQGLSYRALEQLENAERAFEASIELQRALGNVRLLVGVLKNLGVLYREGAQEEKAVGTFGLALEELKQLDDKTVVEQLSKDVGAELAQVRHG